MATKLDLGSILSSMPPLPPGPRGVVLKALAVCKKELRAAIKRVEKYERYLKSAASKS